MNEVIREGERWFHEGGGQYTNPYKLGSAEFNDFERGFFQALKRSPEQPRRYRRSVNSRARLQKALLPQLIPIRTKNELSDDTYLKLATRAREKLLNDPSYRPPKYQWHTKVYYLRIETYAMPLWKIGITCNNVDSRFCIADRKFIVQIKSWQYATRQEVEAIEREVLAEFAGDVYKGGPVLRSGGDGELFVRDVLKLDNQDDFLAMMRTVKQVTDQTI